MLDLLAGGDAVQRKVTQALELGAAPIPRKRRRRRHLPLAFAFSAFPYRRSKRATRPRDEGNPCAEVATR
jgi:hypothetical protein